MATITTRSGKGSPLTNNEVDANFNNLNSGKAELSGATFTGEIVAPSLDISGNIDVDGVTNLDVVDIDGALTQDGGAVFNEASADVDFRIESNGNANMLFVDGGANHVNIGTASDFGDIFNVNGGGHFSSSVTLSRQTNDTGSTGLLFEKTRNTTVNGNTVVQNGDQLGFVAFRGNDGDQFIDGAYIISFVDGTPGNNDMPTNLQFWTTADGASSPSERMRISQDGKIRLGSSGDHVLVDITNSNAALQLVDNNQSNPPTLRGNGPNFTIENGGVERMRIDTGVVFNETGIDQDFRVESNGNTHALFVDGGTNRVGVGRASPASIFEVHMATNKNIGFSGVQGELGSIPALVAYTDSGSTADIGLRGTTVRFASTSQERMRIDETGVVVNDGSHDADFRVESNTLTHALFVDGANGYIGINDSAPSAQLDLNTSSGLMTILNSSHTNGGYVRFEKSGTVYGDLGNGAQIVSGGATTAFGMNTRGTGDLLLATNGVTRASIKNGGAFTTNPLAGGHTVFNEGGVDSDFRIESDNLASAFFLDGGTGKVTMQGATTAIGSGASSTNVEFNLNGVAGKATRIQFQEGTVNKWLLGQGAASETTAFELFNAAGQITLSVNRSTNVATFIAPVISPSFATTAGGTFTTAAGNDLNLVYPANRSLFIKEGSATHIVIDNTGRVLVGQTSNYVAAGGGTTKGVFTHSANSRTDLIVSNQTNGSNAGAALVLGSHGQDYVIEAQSAAQGGALTFSRSTAERLRISSAGDLIIAPQGVAQANNANCVIATDGAKMALAIECASTSSYTAVQFRNGSAQVGNIVTTGSATAFNTSSDHRLKENVDYTWDATTRLKQLKPARFNFIADETNTLVDGFIAHEAATVVPESVTGEKDAVDGDGNPEYQGIDQSKLVPLLVKTIQELEARITALEI